MQATAAEVRQVAAAVSTAHVRLDVEFLDGIPCEAQASVERRPALVEGQVQVKRADRVDAPQIEAHAAFQRDVARPLFRIAEHGAFQRGRIGNDDARPHVRVRLVEEGRAVGP
jgi:hypothetical protein